MLRRQADAGPRVSASREHAEAPSPAGRSSAVPSVGPSSAVDRTGSTAPADHGGALPGGHRAVREPQARHPRRGRRPPGAAGRPARPAQRVRGPLPGARRLLGRRRLQDPGLPGRTRPRPGAVPGGPADAGRDRGGVPPGGRQPLPRRPPGPADRLRGDRRGDHRHQPGAPGLLPAQALGPAARAAVPGPGRPALGLARHLPPRLRRDHRRRPPGVARHPRRPGLLHPQRAAVPLPERRARPRGADGARGRRPRCGAAAGPVPGRDGALRADRHAARPAPGPGDHRLPPALRVRHRRRRSGGAGGRGVLGVRGPVHAHAGLPRPGRPGRRPPA